MLARLVGRSRVTALVEDGRYRLHRQILPGVHRRVDVVFVSARVAVFVDGCFWHGCPDHGVREHAINRWYWPDKIAANKARDLDTDRRLATDGWLVVRVWEHEDMDQASLRIQQIVADRKAERNPPPIGEDTGCG